MEAKKTTKKLRQGKEDAQREVAPTYRQDALRITNKESITMAKKTKTTRRKKLGRAKKMGAVKSLRFTNVRGNAGSAGQSGTTSLS